MRFKEFITEIVLKNAIDGRSEFSDLELEVFSFFCDHPHIPFEQGFHEMEIPVKDLIPMQSNITGTNPDSDDPIVVVKRDGKYFIIDGHHRYGRAKRLKHEKMETTVIDLPSQRNEDDLGWFEKKLGLELKQTNGLVTFR